MAPNQQTRSSKAQMGLSPEELQELRAGGRVFLLDTVEAVLDDPASLFVPAEVRRLSDEHLSGRADHGLKLWTLSLFAAWRKVSGAL